MDETLTLTPTRDFSFLDSERNGSKNGGSPPGERPGVSRTTMHSPPLARHLGVAAWAVISCPYDTRFYDVMGLSAFSSLPLVGFCWTGEG